MGIAHLNIYIYTRYMHTYIVLLRGVMPSGKNRIPKMAELRDAIEAEEFAEVTTYIQSGNIVLRYPYLRRRPPYVSQRSYVPIAVRS